MMKFLVLAALTCAAPLAVVGPLAIASARPYAQEKPAAKPAAKPEAKPEAKPGAAQGAGSYEVDPVHSAVVFRVKHLDVSYFYGRFNEVKGSVDYDPAKPEASKVSLVIPVESIDTTNDKRNAHLLSPDFFNGKEFPKITF